MGIMAILSMEFVSLAAIVGIYVLWLLVPLIPAVLIFWLFPKTSAEVTSEGTGTSGLFAGLGLKLSGAFGAYFVLCLMGYYSWVPQAYVAVGDLKRLAWTVKGTFQMVDNNQKAVHPGDEFFRKICIRTQPISTDFQDSEEAGRFEFSVPEISRKLPALFVETSHNKRVLLKVDDLDYVEKVATIKMLTIPGLSTNISDEAKPQVVGAKQ
jgi:hypothetical protein